MEDAAWLKTLSNLTEEAMVLQKADKKKRKKTGKTLTQAEQLKIQEELYKKQDR